MRVNKINKTISINVTSKDIHVFTNNNNLVMNRVKY